MKNLYKLALILLLAVFAISAVYAEVPAPPANLSVQPGQNGGAVLHWDTSATARTYKVYKSRDGESFFFIGATEHNAFFDWGTEPHHEYRYYVQACNEHGCSDASETVDFHVGPPPPSDVHGTITGLVTDDSTGLPVGEATIKFFRGHELWTVRTHTDTSGMYSVDLDTGRYLVRVEKFGYVPEWFDNALEIHDATVVSVHQDSIETANFGLRPFAPPPVPANVSGMVTDSVNGLPLANALVVFLRPPHLFRMLEEMEDRFGGLESERFEIHELGNLTGVAGYAWTDSSGNYTVHVRRNQRYIALAFKPGFLVKFFDNKYNPFDADRIGVTHDTAGVNFALARNPITANALSGSVVDSSGLGIPSHVVLLRLTPFGVRVVRYRMTDTLGNYDFHNLVAGNFFIRAIPLDDYSPAWYSTSLCGVRNWHNADTVHVNGSVSGINICVKSTSCRGFARIAGQITNPGNLDAVSPSQGVTVYAVDNATNAIVGYDVTEDNGSFSIDNLPGGTYDIVVDKEGYSSSTTPTYTVDGSNNYQESNAAITISPDGVTSVEDGVTALPTQYRLEQNYPNPFNPSTTIRFELPKMSTVSLKIYNLIGQEIAVLSNTTLSAGSFAMQWNGTDRNGNLVSSGIYFVKLVAAPLDGSAASYNQTRKISLMK